MPQTTSQYLTHCPIGCQGSLIATEIILSEGPLLRCTQCRQLLSSCTENDYWHTMQEFNTSQGTLPDIQSSTRAFKVHKQKLSSLSQLLNKPPAEITLLDIGCSSGAFLNSARSVGFKVEGVEPAPKAAETAKNKGLEVHIGMLEDLQLPANTYDVITLFEVIEHLKDPISLLTECHRILKPSGLMMIGTGNADSWTLQFMRERWEYLHLNKHGGHISFYNSQSMQKLAETTNFDVVSIATKRVRFYEKEDVSKLLYKITKFAAECLNYFAQKLHKGHDLLVILRKKA